MAVDHDQLFKTLLKAFFREFMELFLPKQAALMDFSRIEFLEQEVFTDIPKGKRRHLDLVAKVGLKAGGDEFVLVHNEYQAEREADFARRMFRCYCHLFSRHDTVIVPVAVFSDDAVWKKPLGDTFTLGLGGSRYVRFRYHLIKLKHLDYRRYLKSKNPLAYALMAKMNYNRGQALRLKQDFFRLVVGAPIDPARKSLLVEFIDTYIRLDKREEKQFNKVVRREPELREARKMATTWELAGLRRGLRRGLRQGREEGLRTGLRQGIRKGRSEGEIRGKQATLLLLLERRFGKLSPEVKRKVRAIDSARRLKSLALAVLDAQSLDQLGL